MDSEKAGQADGEEGLTGRLWRPVAAAGTVVAACIAAILLGPAIAPKPALIVAVCAWLTALVTVLWLCAVLFRSALAHGMRGGAPATGYGVAAVAALAAITVAATGAGIAVADIGRAMERLRVSMRIVPTILVSGSELVFDSYIDRGAAQVLREAAARHPGITRIRLGGEGGELHEAEWIRDLIAEKGWDTHAAGECWSGCVIAFLGGRHRTIGPGARMGFHSASIWPPGSEERERAVNERIAAQMIARGVDADFARKAWRKQPVGLWFAPHEELIRAGLVHEVVKP